MYLGNPLADVHVFILPRKVGIFMGGISVKRLINMLFELAITSGLFDAKIPIEVRLPTVMIFRWPYCQSVERENN